jgi:hypothetical protein
MSSNPVYILALTIHNMKLYTYIRDRSRDKDELLLEQALQTG